MSFFRPCCERKRSSSAVFVSVHLKRAFTLIELLVVIGILSVLLLPARARAKVPAMRIPHLNRQESLGAICQMCAGDNNDLPSATTDSGGRFEFRDLSVGRQVWVGLRSPSSKEDVTGPLFFLSEPGIYSLKANSHSGAGQLKGGPIRDN